MLFMLLLIEKRFYFFRVYIRFGDIGISMQPVLEAGTGIKPRRRAICMHKIQRRVSHISQGHSIYTIQWRNWKHCYIVLHKVVWHLFCVYWQFHCLIILKVKVNGANAAPVYKFLISNKKGHFGGSIKWNFTKFLVDRDGHVINRYGTTTSPQAIEVSLSLPHSLPLAYAPLFRILLILPISVLHCRETYKRLWETKLERIHVQSWRCHRYRWGKAGKLHAASPWKHLGAKCKNLREWKCTILNFLIFSTCVNIGLVGMLYR